MYTIYSIGDEAYLYKIFQFLAMLNSSGTTLYGRLGLLAALIGLILVIVALITSGGKRFEIGSYLIAIVLFLVFFQPTNVELIDFYTGRTDIVQDVPLGTALVGDVVSQAGTAIIKLFQTGLSEPGAAELPPQYALDALMAYRNLSNQTNFCGGSGQTLCKWTRTFQSYVSSCVVPEYRMNGGWWNGDPLTAPNMLDALGGIRMGFVTYDYLGNIDAATTSTGQVSNCENTYADLQSAVNAPNSKVMAEIAGQMGLPTPPNTSTDAALTQAFNVFLRNAARGPAASSGANNTLAGKLTQAAEDSQQSMLNAVGANLLARGITVADANAGQVGEAQLIESASQQRNVQFAAKSSLFTRTMRATMTFFEGTIYGLAPFLAFLIPLGAPGFRYAGRYLSLLAWLFLWMPLLSFVNLFEVMSVLRQMDALLPAIGNAPLISAVGLNQIEYTVSDWIGIGGYLTTAVVGLSGMLVFGAIAGFSSLAAEAGTPSSVPAASLAPDVLSNAPPIQRGSMVASAGGSAGALAGGAMPSFSASAQLQRTATTSWNDAVNLAHQLQAHGQFSAQINHQTLEAWAERYALSHHLAAGGALAASAPTGHRVTAGHGSSITSTASLGGHLGGSVSAGGLPIGGLQAGLNKQWSQRQDAATQEAMGKDSTASANLSDQRGSDRALSSDAGTHVASSHSTSASVSKTESDLYSAVRTYNTATSAMHSTGASLSVSLPQAAHALAADPAALARAGDDARGWGGHGAWHEAMQHAEALLPGGNEAQVEAAGSLLALQQAANGSGRFAGEAQQALDQALGTVPGWSSFNALGTAAAVGQGQTAGAALRGSVGAAVKGVPGATASAEGLGTNPDGIQRLPDVAPAAFTRAADSGDYSRVGLTERYDSAAMRAEHDANPVGPAPLEPIAAPVHTPGQLEAGLQDAVNTEFGHPGAPVQPGQKVGLQQLTDADAWPSAAAFESLTPEQQAALQRDALAPSNPSQESTP